MNNWSEAFEHQCDKGHTWWDEEDEWEPMSAEDFVDAFLDFNK